MCEVLGMHAVDLYGMLLGRSDLDNAGYRVCMPPTSATASCYTHVSLTVTSDGCCVSVLLLLLSAACSCITPLRTRSCLSQTSLLTLWLRGWTRHAAGEGGGRMGGRM
jgi:hypothetical protein